jgi:integrase
MNKKDLSFQAKAEQRRQLLLENIRSVNETMKYEKVGVTLITKGESLILRYRDLDRRRKEISPMGVNLSPAGLAIKISNAISAGYYNQEWLDRDIYRNPIVLVTKPQTPILTWLDVSTTYVDKWLEHRKGDRTSTDRQKARTLTGYRAQLKLAGQVEPHTPFDVKLITELLSRQPEGSDKRFRLREVLSVISQLFGIAYDYKGIGKRTKPLHRDIPSDDEIVSAYCRFNSIQKVKRNDAECIPVYQWYFGMLATYGLRPQELWGIDLEQSFRADSDYWIYLDESLTDGLKTGDRWVAPLNPDWVRLFDLVTPKYKAGLTGDLQTRVNGIGKYFRLHDIGVKPYDLRHAYAIRCRTLGIELLDAADLMGHDPQTHHKQYHRWIGKDEKLKSVRSALTRNRLLSET